MTAQRLTEEDSEGEKGKEPDEDSNHNHIVHKFTPLFLLLFLQNTAAAFQLRPTHKTTTSGPGTTYTGEA